VLSAVLDGSVLISAFATPRGTCADVLRAAGRGAFAMHVSPEILAETGDKLRGKPKLQARYGYGERDVAEFCDDLAASARLMADLPRLRAVPLDLKDDMVVATAVAPRADYLVTGDRRHLLVLGT